MKKEITRQPPFSVLCSLYAKEQAAYLSQCLESIKTQSLMPNEVVIVHDGPLTKELYSTLEYWREILPIRDVKLKHNLGLGKALNTGLQACSNDFVLRVDTDDINNEFRFEKQINFLVNHPDVAAVSGHISEFEIDPNKSSSIRCVPSTNSAIREFSLKRNPMNHMAVAFRKSAIIEVGSYQDHLYMEDYDLWLRLMANGYKLANLNETLVNARVGNGMLSRRKGVKYARSELLLAKKIYALKLTTKPTSAIYFFCKAAIRLLPSTVLKKAYRKSRKNIQ